MDLLEVAAEIVEVKILDPLEVAAEVIEVNVLDFLEVASGITLEVKGVGCGSSDPPAGQSLEP